MKFPDDFQYVQYSDSKEEIQSTIDRFIELIENSDDGAKEVATGNVSVKKIGDKYFVTVYPGCWFPK